MRVPLEKMFGSVEGDSSYLEISCIVFPVLFPGLQSLFAKIGLKFIPTETEKFYSDVVSQAIDIREKDASVSVGTFMHISAEL